MLFAEGQPNNRQPNSDERRLAGAEPAKTDPISGEQSFTGGDTAMPAANSSQPQTHERR